MFFCGPSWLRKVLVFNGEKPSPPHSLETMRKFLPYSRFGTFLLEARTVVFRLLNKYKVEVDKEAYFLVSIVHSLDHFMSVNTLPSFSSSWLLIFLSFFLVLGPVPSRLGVSCTTRFFPAGFI
jgi:hypothetical protein